MIKTYKNFVAPAYLKQLQETFMNKDFNGWRLIEYQSDKEDQEYLVHNLFYRFYIKSPHFKLIEPLLNQMNVKALIEARVNMNIRKEKQYRSSFHTDTTFPSFTAIFYLNNCNGWTEFETGEKIDCEENKLLVFDSHQRHAAVHQTDNIHRCLINLNYF